MEFKDYSPNCSILLWLALHFEAGSDFAQIGSAVSAAITTAAPDLLLHTSFTKRGHATFGGMPTG
eukprot:7386133-Prymnesium_polylepis.2